MEKVDHGWPVGGDSVRPVRIAGTGATSTATVGYTAATVGVQRLMEAVPGLKNVAKRERRTSLSGCQRELNNEYWFKLAALPFINTRPQVQSGCNALGAQVPGDQAICWSDAQTGSD